MPYSSLPKISGICLFTMPGPLSCTPTLNRFAAGLFDVHPDFRQDPRFLAGVQRVVDRFLDGRQQRLARIVETQQMAVLGKELADRNVPLFGGHGFGRDTPGPGGLRGGDIQFSGLQNVTGIVRNGRSRALSQSPEIPVTWTENRCDCGRQTA